MDNTDKIAGLIAAAYLQENGIKNSDEILNRYNAKGIDDEEAIMLIVLSAFYQKSPYRKRLR